MSDRGQVSHRPTHRPRSQKRTGSFASEALGAAGYRVAGADASLGMLRVFRERFPTTAVAARSDDLPFPDGEFDGVLCVALLHQRCGGEALARMRGPFRVLLSQRLRRVGGHTLEHRQVKLVGSKPNRVAGRARLDSRRRPEQLPQVGDLPLHLLQRRCGSSPGVEVVCEAIDRDDAVRLQEQYRERRPLLRPAKLERAALADDLEWPQDPELEQFAGPYSFDTASAPGASTITAIQERSERCTS